MAEEENTNTQEKDVNTFDSLSGTQKSAILMMLLGEDEASEILLIISGIIALVIMLLSYIKLPRNKGYVMYLASVCSFFGRLVLYVLSTYSNDFIPLSF